MYTCNSLDFDAYFIANKCTHFCHALCTLENNVYHVLTVNLTMTI